MSEEEGNRGKRARARQKGKKRREGQDGMGWDAHGRGCQQKGKAMMMMVQRAQRARQAGGRKERGQHEKGSKRRTGQINGEESTPAKTRWENERGGRRGGGGGGEKSERAPRRESE